jgi:hypothetical protein
MGRSMGKTQEVYRKHAYWLTREEENHLRKELESRGHKMKTARGIVCSPLDRINKLASVAPGVWDETCSRQGSWYRASDKNGLYLVVSSFELEELSARKAATITESDFRPPRLATREEKESLVSEFDVQSKIPSEWPQVKEREKEIYLRWAERLGSKGVSYDFLFLSHTANHGNFIRPRLYLSEGREVIPYSIDRSAHLCSCCLELFQIIGGEYRRKLVAPCPGAVAFARMKPDRYLLAEGH